MQGTRHLQYHFVGCNQRADAEGGNNKVQGQSGNKDGLKRTSKHLFLHGSVCAISMKEKYICCLQNFPEILPQSVQTRHKGPQIRISFAHLLVGTQRLPSAS